jgi:hypothetical protein
MTSSGDGYFGVLHFDILKRFGLNSARIALQPAIRISRQSDSVVRGIFFFSSVIESDIGIAVKVAG